VERGVGIGIEGVVKFSTIIARPEEQEVADGFGLRELVVVRHFHFKYKCISVMLARCIVRLAELF
jgi:hypothetical protein